MKIDKLAPHFFVLDVDGTLLNSLFEILSSTRVSIGKLFEKNHHVALASTRPPRSVAARSSQLLSNETEMVSLNGALISLGQEILHERSTSPDTATCLIEEAHKRGLQPNLLTGWDWLVEEITPEVAAEAKVIEFQPTTTTDLLTEVSKPIHKMLFLGKPEKVQEFRDWIRGGSLGLEAALSKPTYCEVVAEGVSKAAAVRCLAELFGIPFSNTVVFGMAKTTCR